MDENGSFRHHLVASFNMFQSMGLNSKEQKIMIPMFQNKRYKNISRLQHDQYSFETTNLPGNSRHLVAPTPPIQKKTQKSHNIVGTRLVGFPSWSPSSGVVSFLVHLLRSKPTAVTDPWHHEDLCWLVIL